MNDYKKKIIEQLWSLPSDYREEIIKEILDKASRSNEDRFICEHLKKKESESVALRKESSFNTQLSTDHAASYPSQSCSTPCEKPVQTATCESSKKESDHHMDVDEDEDDPSISLWEAFDDIDIYEGFSRRRQKAQKESSVECLGRKETSKPTCKSASDSNNHENVDEGDVDSDFCLWDAYDDIEVSEDVSQSSQSAEKKYRRFQRFRKKKTFEEKFFKKYPDAQCQIFEYGTEVQVLESHQWMLKPGVLASEIDEMYTVMHNNMLRDYVREGNLQPHRGSLASNSSLSLDEDDDFMDIPVMMRSKMNVNGNRILSDSESDGSDNMINPDDNQPSTSTGRKQPKRVRMPTSNRAKKPRKISDDDSEDEMDKEPWDLPLYSGESDDCEMEEVKKVKEIREKNIHLKSPTNMDTNSEPRFRRKRSVDGKGKQGSLLSKKRCPSKFSAKERQIKTTSSLNNGIRASKEDRMAIDTDGKGVENIPPDSNVPDSINLKRGRKNIRDLKDDAEITRASRQANKKEKERMQRVMRINELLEACSAIKDKKRLILDVDPKTNEPRVEVHPELVKHLKDHQFKGIQFMYTNTIENVDLLKEDHEGTGCIIAHCMGLGKTLQVVAYVHTILNHPFLRNKFRKIMIAAPVNTLRNWYDEFRKWQPSSLNIYQMVDQRDNLSRARMLGKWYDHGGVLIIGLQGFTNLSKFFNNEAKNIPLAFKEDIEVALINPGPDILIIDEGHLLKNDESENFQAFCRVPTERKIILTGTPLQNNLEEYYTMIDLIKPRLLGIKKEFANRFKNPIENGQHYDSTHGDILLMKERCAVLEKLLTGSIQRFDYEVLEPYLEPKYEYSIFVQATDLVVKLYNYYLDNISKVTGRNRSILDDSNLLRLICNHPALLPMRSEKEAKLAASRAGKNMQEIERTKQSTNQECNRSEEPYADQITVIREDLVGESSKIISNPGSGSDGSAQPVDKSIDDNSAEWFRKFMKDGESFREIELSAKFVVFFFILEQCVIKNEKLIVVSQFLKTLDLIEEFLASHKKIRSSPTQAREIEWIKDRSYFRIDGSVSSDKRKLYIDTFNNPNNREAKMFLLAVKAGGLGVNLVGANRAIIFDTHWNPMIDMQAIFRIYRLGQTRPAYIYRLITKDTLEEKIYFKQILKTGLSMRVVDKTNIKNSIRKADVEEYYSIRPQKRTETKEFPTIPKDDLLGDLILAHKESIVEYREQDSLLQKKPEENLDKQQRRKAWEDYKRERVGGNTVKEKKREANSGQIEISETDCSKDNQVKTNQPSSLPSSVTPTVSSLPPQPQISSHESNGNILPANRIVPKINCAITSSVPTNSSTLAQASTPSTSMGTTSKQSSVKKKGRLKKVLTPAKPTSSVSAENEALLTSSAGSSLSSSMCPNNSTSKLIPKVNGQQNSDSSNPPGNPPASTFPVFPSNAQQHPPPPPVTESHPIHLPRHKISVISNEKFSIINDEDLSNGLLQGLSLVDCSLLQLSEKLINSNMGSRAVGHKAMLKTIQDCLEDFIDTVRHRKFQASISNTIVNIKLASSCDKILKHLDEELREAKISDPTTGMPFVLDRDITKEALNIIARQLATGINLVDEINRRDELCNGEKLAQQKQLKQQDDQSSRNQLKKIKNNHQLGPLRSKRRKRQPAWLLV